MACYGALQEGATYVAYKVQKDKARCDSDEVLEAIFHFVGRDQAAHAGFYRAMIELELSHDRMGTLDDMAYVPSTFRCGSPACISWPCSGAPPTLTRER
jgi:acyl-[acyl-carrier-protein] desaturase